MPAGGGALRSEWSDPEERVALRPGLTSRSVPIKSRVRRCEASAKAETRSVECSIQRLFLVVSKLVYTFHNVQYNYQKGIDKSIPLHLYSIIMQPRDVIALAQKSGVSGRSVNRHTFYR